MRYGIQLYSVRDTMPTVFEGTLRRLAEMGYKDVEFFDYYGKTAEEVSAMINDFGLSIIGTHIHFTDLVADFEALCAFYQSVGNSFIVEPMADLSTREKLDAFVELTKNIIPKLKEKGFNVCYHNHRKEFIPNEDGIIPFNFLLEKTDLDFELDTFWTYAAGRDSVRLLDELGGRLALVHIKDGFLPTAKEKAKGMPLGKGTAPVREVHSKALALNIPMIVESETLSPDGLSEAGVCMNYLRSIDNERRRANGKIV